MTESVQRMPKGGHQSQSQSPRSLRPRRRDHRPLFVAGVAIGLSFVPLIVSSEARPIVLPLIALVIAGLAYTAEMLRRDGRIPVVETGSVFVLVVVVYGGVPLLNFLAGGLTWGMLADNRLVQYASTPAEVGRFAWYSVLLLTSFVITYLLVRGRVAPLRLPLNDPPSSVVAAVVAITLGLLAYFWLMAVFFDLSYDQGYVELQAGTGPGRGTHLPLIVQQVSHNLRGVLDVEKQFLLILLINGWRSLRNRVFVAGLLCLEVVRVLTTMGGRSEAVALLMTFIFAYDRFVRPLSMKAALAIFSSALVAVLTYGVMRDARMSSVPGSTPPIATAANEFQVLWGTAFDLKTRRDAGLIEVPWQLYLSDLYLPIPGQLLPFEKINPSLWYLDAVIGNRSTGYMFGILAQAAIGLGMWEVALRGMLLAGCLALFHRWYARNQSRFWATAAYFFVMSWTYYSYRATTFYWIYYVIYQFLPAMLLTAFLALLIRVPRRRKTRNGVKGTRDQDALARAVE